MTAHLPTQHQGHPVPVPGALRVLVVDQHPIVLAGLRSLLEGEFELTCAETDGPGALRAIEEQAPEVAVLDQQIPGLSGLRLVQELAQRSAKTKVVLLWRQDEGARLAEAIDSGVAGVVSLENAWVELPEALRAVGRGDVYLSPRAAAQFLKHGRREARQKADPRALSPRERQVMALVAAGLTSRQIGAELRLAPKTVEGHRAAIMAKLEIDHLAGLVKWAIRNQLATLND
jgi:DNA-binding NarL/FixJ family response regulator